MTVPSGVLEVRPLFTGYLAFIVLVLVGCMVAGLVHR